MKSRYGSIYALYYNDKPIYIGQTKRKPEKRYNDHKKHCFNNLHREYNKSLYKFIRDELNINIDEFDNLIKVKTIKVVEFEELDHWEYEAIKFCINKGINLYNVIGVTRRYIGQNKIKTD